MSRYAALVGVLLLVWASRGVAQFSGYFSTTYGYNSNPLYNYRQLSDRVAQTYMQLGYEKEYENSILSLGYVNGVALFNQFGDRNYVEQSLLGRYKIVFWKTDDEETESSDEAQDDSTDEQNGEADNQGSDSTDAQSVATVQDMQTSALGLPAKDTVEQFDDSTNAYLDFGAKLSGRHDKSEHDEFDNYGGELSSAYRMMIGENYFLRIANGFSYRSYANIPDLSNIANALLLQLGSRTNKSLDYGLDLLGGIRHYTRNVYDTTRFEPVRTYVEKPSGKGKLGGKIKVPSGKLLLTNSGTSTTYQLVFGAYMTKKWEQSSLGYSALFRISSKSPSRYIAQFTTNSTLSEDIYNDHFSYEGFETFLVYTQKLPLEISAVLSLSLQKKKFGAPAYSLNGDEIAPKRKDLRSAIELGVSRPFELGQGFSLELSLEFGALRNQSNDDYSDFGTFNFGVGIGIGF